MYFDVVQEQQKFSQAVRSCNSKNNPAARPATGPARLRSPSRDRDRARLLSFRARSSEPAAEAAVLPVRRVSLGRLSGTSRSCLLEVQRLQRREAREGGSEGGSAGVANLVMAAAGRGEGVCL